MTASRRTSPTREVEAVADRLHSAALHLLRRLRIGGRCARHLPSPAVGPLGRRRTPGRSAIGALAAAEGVAAPTMTRLVDGLERDGFVRRRRDPGDARGVLVEATPAGEDPHRRAARNGCRPSPRASQGCPRRARPDRRGAELIERVSRPPDWLIRSVQLTQGGTRTLPSSCRTSFVSREHRHHDRRAVGPRLEPVDRLRRHDDRVADAHLAHVVADVHRRRPRGHGEHVEVIVVMRRERAAGRQVDPEQRRLVGAPCRRGERRDRVAAELEGGVVGGAFDRHGRAPSGGGPAHHATRGRREVNANRGQVEVLRRRAAAKGLRYACGPTQRPRRPRCWSATSCAAT